MITRELYIAGFTGTLTSFVTHSGKQFTIQHSFPKVVKGQPFVVEADSTTNRMRMIPIMMPPYDLR